MARASTSAAITLHITNDRLTLAEAGGTSTKARQTGKKRSLALANGVELDLNAPSLPLSKDVFDAMKARILQLEEELAQYRKPTKRAKTTAATPVTVEVQFPAKAEAQTIVPRVAPTKAEEKMRKAQLKKIFDRLKKECKSNDVKFQGTPKTIKFDEIYSVEDFEALFGGHGYLIQPTPTNKPKSAVTIMEFNGPMHINDFFGDELKTLTGNVWTRGGGPSFAKSVKLGTCDVTIQSFDISYSKNNMKCTFKFEVEGIGSDLCGGGGGYNW